MIIFLDRLTSSRYVDNLVVATTNLPADDRLSDIVTSSGFPVFQVHKKMLLGVM